MELMEKVKRHHQLVAEHMGVSEDSFELVYTVLIGSQNYCCDIETSDIDTCTLVLPSFTDFTYNHDTYKTEFEVDDGKCVIKDARECFRLLRRPSPNSIEWFLGPYRYCNPLYENIVNHYLDNEKTMFYMTHCNYQNMINSCIGTAKGMLNRNMSLEKRFGHALRLYEMLSRYCASKEAFCYLPLRTGDAELVRELKRGRRYPYHTDEYFETEIQSFINAMEEYASTNPYPSNHEEIEHEGAFLSTRFQDTLMVKYMTEMTRGIDEFSDDIT